MNLLLSDINLNGRQQICGEVEEDASCDIVVMISVMHRAGAVIRKMHWIQLEQNCYQVMNNAGGHGTNNVMLHDKYNMNIIFQISISPFTYVLNLEVWMSLQSPVGRQHYLQQCNTSTLVNIVILTTLLLSFFIKISIM